MKRQRHTRISLGVAAFALAAAVVLVSAGAASEPTEATASTAAPISRGADGAEGVSSTGVSGLRVHLDPLTGELRSRPVDPTQGDDDSGRLGPHERLNTYGGDLLQERLDQGGFKVDLRGRFQSSVVATIDPETDEVSIDCVSAPVAGESEGNDHE